MKKRMIFCFVFCMYIISITHVVNANFVCGEVEYTNYTYPSWLNVNVYYSEKPNNYTSCKVSPDKFRYCCDPLEIKSVGWQVGKTINASVFDLESGYFSNSTSLVISGEGFDVFPKLYVEKGININYPTNKVYINNNSFHINVSSASIFNDLIYSISSYNYNNSSIICNGCNRGDLYFENIPSGNYNLEINAANNNINYSNSINFSLIDYITISRNFECKGCSSQRIKSGSEVNVTLFVNLSHYSEGKLLEYVPIDWTIMTDQEIEPFSETHNLIYFDVSGKEVEFNYTLMPPNNILSKKYTFIGSFEDIYLEEQNITLSKFKLLDLFASVSKVSITERNMTEYKTFLKVNPNEPLIYEPNLDYIEELAVFSKNYNKNVKIKLSNRYLPLELEENLVKGSKIFSFQTNINEEKIDKMYFKLKLNNSEFNQPSFYFYNMYDRNSSKINYSIYDADDEYSYYYIENKEYGYYLLINGEIKNE